MFHPNLTPELLQKMTGCGALRAATYALPLTSACAKHGINTPDRIAGFIGTCAHESEVFSRLEESLNYSVEALVAKFGRHRISVADANAYGRKPGQAANQLALGNTLYGGTFGLQNLGNTQPGDGHYFRGRGLIQLTGRSWYTRYEQASGNPVRTKPDLLTTPSGAADSAAWFWATKGCNAFADKRDWAGLTRVVNGGSNGLADRVQRIERARRALTA